jgi:hypothetical protein
MLAYQTHSFVENSSSFLIAAVKLPETTSQHLIEGRVASSDTTAQARPAFVDASTNRKLRPDPSPLGVGNIFAKAIAGGGIGKD